MTVEEAIARAKSYITRIFAGEEISQIRLEEVEYDEAEAAWLVTIGLLRPSLSKRGLPALMGDAPLKRHYKVVKIFNDSGSIPSVKIRQPHEEE